MIIKKQNRTADKAQSVSSVAKPVEKSLEEEKIDLFDLDNIDFSQRQERRRGDRRRGYRRIDDRNLISRAQEEAEMIKEAAAKEGYRAGLTQAEADIEILRQVISCMINAKQEVFEYIAPDILEISVEIARKIVKKEIEQDPQIILDSILDVLKTISKEESRITIKVNSLEADLISSELPESVKSMGIEARLNIVADESVEEGGCIVCTANGIVDATLSTQFEILKTALKGM